MRYNTLTTMNNNPLAVESSSPIKAVIFDVFGVLYPNIGADWFNTHINDPSKAPAFRALAARVDLGELSRTEQLQEWSELSRVPTDEIEEQLRAAMVVNDALVERVIKPLARTVKLGILSNANDEWVRVPFMRDGLSTHFDEIILSANVGVTKPQKGIFDIALRRLGVTASQAVFIDDMPENVAAASRLDMIGIRFSSTEDLEHHLQSRQIL